MREEALQQVFTAVIILQNLPRLRCWWGFTSAADRQHVKAVLCRCVRYRLCPPQLVDLTELVDEAADDKLYQLILNNDHIQTSLLYEGNLTVVITWSAKPRPHGDWTPVRPHKVSYKVSLEPSQPRTITEKHSFV